MWSRSQWECPAFPLMRVSISRICLCPSSGLHVQQGSEVPSSYMLCTSSLLLSHQMLNCLRQCILAPLQLMVPPVSLPFGEGRGFNLLPLQLSLTLSSGGRGSSLFCWIGVPLDWGLPYSPAISGPSYPVAMMCCPFNIVLDLTC